MSTFTEAVLNLEARTENGMKARRSSASNVVDLFYNIGSYRTRDIKPLFTAAYAENKSLALRVALWGRDARGGAGERQTFRNILTHLSLVDIDACIALIHKTPELGRWDDLLIKFHNPIAENEALNLIKSALESGNALCAKWMPRQGPLANKIRCFMGIETPKQFRKMLVGLTIVVESQMCAKEWDSINFSHVPSVASARYKKAFYRNTPAYAAWVAALVKGEDPKVKVNAGAIFPHDVIKGLNEYTRYNETETNVIVAQWNALPNYVNEARVLPLIDVSGSMYTPIDSTGTVSALDVAVSVGLYIADKNKGPFKDTFLTFNTKPELVHLKGNIAEKIMQTVQTSWSMSTDLHAAFDAILDTAIAGNVSVDDMPETLLILSDMQFDRVGGRNAPDFDESAIEMIRRKYDEAGYTMPHIVFWNLDSKGSVPVQFKMDGVALVSGFSPAILSAVLSADMDEFTPESVMLKAIMKDRYSVNL